MCQKQMIAEMMSSIDAYEELDNYETRMPYLTIFVATSTVIMSLALPIFFYGMWDEPIEILLDNSYGFSVDLFMWNWRYVTIVGLTP